MKKIFIFLGLMFVMLSGTYAQKDRQAIGFGLSYGTEIESAGLGIRHYKIFCVNGNTGFRNESRIFYFIHLQNEEAYERKESSSA